MREPPFGLSWASKDHGDGTRKDVAFKSAEKGNEALNGPDLRLPVRCRSKSDEGPGRREQGLREFVIGLVGPGDGQRRRIEIGEREASCWIFGRVSSPAREVRTVRCFARTK